MSLLLIGAQRYSLPDGETVLGGSDCVIAPLADFPRFAVVHVESGSATVRSLQESAALLALDGAAVEAETRPLRHGARLDIRDLGGSRSLSGMIYGDARLVDASTEPVAGVPDEALAASAEAPNEPAERWGARLVVVATGARIDMPASGLVIGRAPECHLVLADAEVSRRHVAIRPSPDGYVLLDTSSNGVWINRQRVERAQLLSPQDVIRVGAWDLRFEDGPPGH